MLRRGSHASARRRERDEEDRHERRSHTILRTRSVRDSELELATPFVALERELDEAVE
jgi:hypothetical protein